MGSIGLPYGVCSEYTGEVDFEAS